MNAAPDVVSRGGTEVVYAAGSRAMLRGIAEFCLEQHIPSQVAVEERMGCGFGACAVCACAVQTADGLDYKKACIDGPVFDMDEVVI